MLVIADHASYKYAPRTYVNAKTSDLTVAFAVDFSTAGEWCTKKAAGDKYIGIYLSEEPEKAIAMLADKCRELNVETLNVAGNGIYTLLKEDVTQPMVNSIVYRILKGVHERYPLKHIVSGGQTGVDTAGIVAGYALGIPCKMLLPKGFVQRLEDGMDTQCCPKFLEREVLRYAALLQQEPTRCPTT